MNIIKIIVNNLFIQNFVSSIVALIHPYIGGTISKYSAIRKVFYITAQDDTLGDYLEFGVFTGSSFNFAIKINRVIDKIIGKKTNCQFFGFDSFLSGWPGRKGGRVDAVHHLRPETPEKCL